MKQIILLTTILFCSGYAFGQKTDSVKAETKQPIYSYVEQMPEFPSGEKGLMEFLSSKIRYPKEALNLNIQGIVYLKFNINERGEIDSIKITKDPGGGLGAEAVRVVQLMPKWKPGIEKGVPVTVHYTLPVNFSLTSD